MNEQGVLHTIYDVTGWFPDVHSGEGAFGGVWTCEDGEHHRRAVKIVFKSEDDEDWKHELKSLKLYQSKAQPHPNLIQIYRIEEFEDYFFYFIDAADNMVGEISYIPGTLDIYDEFYQIDNSEIIDIFEQLLDGLDALHAARLVHRDIKPENIIMVDGIPKFSDIGLVASALEPYRVAGTGDFIPPELLGRTKKITPQSGYEADIFALGKTLYTIFSGSKANFFPIIGADKLATPEGKIINRTINAVCHPSYARRLKTSDEFRKALRGIPVKPHR